MNPNMQQARQYENQALIAIGLVGWLTTAQVAAWLWPGPNKHAATNKAGRVLARLTKNGLLMRRQTCTGIWAYLLTNTGAGRANHAYEMPLFRAGYDLSMLDVYRQSTIVAHLIEDPAEVKLGPAGIRGGIRCGLVQHEDLAGADTLTWAPFEGWWSAAILVRSLHHDALAKARRVRACATSLRLLGLPHLVQQFEMAMH